ncbi:uncharacterized protein LOC125543127 [Triticum urartu]|uniref:uncharacterized protein LOC125543127 n=1 Tax=Triticum urartu TaxID=4572 RepID=UPI002043456B|nr:uncharacterized protein LOC125543127 [Triticum urartu]
MLNKVSRDGLGPIKEPGEEDPVLHPPGAGLLHRRRERAGEQDAPLQALHLLPLHGVLVELDDVDRRPTEADQDGHELVLAGLDEVAVFAFEPEAPGLLQDLKPLVVHALVVHRQPPVLSQQVEQPAVEDRVTARRRHERRSELVRGEVPVRPPAIAVPEGERGLQPQKHDRADTDHPARRAVAAVADDEVEPDLIDRRHVPRVAPAISTPRAMKGTEDSALDRSFSPLLLFGHKHPRPHGTNADGEPDEDAENDETEKKAEDPLFFFYSISRRRSVCKIVDDLRDHLYWTTPHGWLLMAHPDSRLTFLWNPFTRQRVGLPPDRDKFLTLNPVRCLLSHEPTDPACVVLVVNCVDTVLWYCRPGGAAEWSEHGYYQAGTLGTHHDRDGVIHAMNLVTAAGGKFYASLLGATVLTLEFSSGPAFAETPIAEQPCHPMYRVWSLHLLESRGELFSVSLYHPLMGRCDKVAQIVVRRLDLPARAWVEVDAVGDRAFFLVDAVHFGASLGAEEAGLKGNCVYYLRRGEKGLYVYDMGRGTTAMHDPGPDLPTKAPF